MLTPDLLTVDQQDTIDRLYENDHTLLVANMGAGKTVVTLTALSELLRDKQVSRVLVIAPLKVCNTVWQQEGAGWSHLTHLDIGIATGNEKKRRAVLDAGHQITCINFENLAWLFRTYKAKGMFDALVVDELTKLKSVGGTQFKAMRPRLNDFKWRLGMTGTVVSEDWTGLFGQMLVVDGGQRLGTRKDEYLRKYFYATDYNEYNWELHPWAAEAVAGLISDVVYTMPDYRAELPPLNVRSITLTMPPELRKTYDELRKTMVVDMGGGDEVAAESAAILSNKLLQCANGFLYGPKDPVTGKKETHLLSDYKHNAAERQIDDWLDQGHQVMVCYWYGADRQRLEDLYGEVSLMSDEAVERWNAGKQDVLLLHPRSAGHGLNLAAGGCRMLWIGPVWSRDLCEQTIARLWRRGQKEAVEVVTLLADDSIDQLVVSRVEEKGEYEVLFQQHLGG
jgi:hypothetical protein